MCDEPWKNLFNPLELFEGPTERNQPMEPDERDWVSLKKPSTLEQRRVFWKSWLEELPEWDGELERNQPDQQQEREWTGVFEDAERVSDEGDGK